MNTNQFCWYVLSNRLFARVGYLKDGAALLWFSNEYVDTGAEYS